MSQELRDMKCVLEEIRELVKTLLSVVGEAQTKLPVAGGKEKTWIGDLFLPVRVRKALIRENVEYLEDLRERTLEEFLHSGRGFGRTSLKELMRVMYAHGVHFKENVDVDGRAKESRALSGICFKQP